MRFTLLLWLGCARQGPSALADLEVRLQAADRAWEARDAGGLGPAQAALADLERLAPGEPEVSWRLVRLRVAEGLGAEDPSEARAAFARGRQAGVDCLARDPLFLQRSRSEGWGVAVSGVGPERIPCAAWLGMAWARWIVALGPEAAALDLDRVRSLLDAAERSGEADLAPWARAILDGSTPPAAGGDAARALSVLRASVERDPRSALRRWDLIRYGLIPSGLQEEAAAQWEQIRTVATKSPEDAAALRAEP